MRSPSGGRVYFTSLTKASANNNSESELRPPEPTGCASRNGLYNRPKPRHKENYSFEPGQPRGMNLTGCGLKHCLDKYQRVFTQNSQCIVKTDNLYAHFVVGFCQSYFIASIKGFPGVMTITVQLRNLQAIILFNFTFKCCLIEINSFIQQLCIQLIESDSKDCISKTCCCFDRSIHQRILKKMNVKNVCSTTAFNIDNKKCFLNTNSVH